MNVHTIDFVAAGMEADRAYWLISYDDGTSVRMDQDDPDVQPILDTALERSRSGMERLMASGTLHG